MGYLDELRIACWELSNAEEGLKVSSAVPNSGAE